MVYYNPQDNMNRPPYNQGGPNQNNNNPNNPNNNNNNGQYPPNNNPNGAPPTGQVPQVPGQIPPQAQVPQALPPSPMHPWYMNGYHHPHQGAQIVGPPPPVSYCMQDEHQQLWASHHPHHHAVFHNEFGEFVTHSPASSAGGGANLHQGVVLHHHNQVADHMPSPPITLSAGSDLSISPGAGSGTPSPHNHIHHHHQVSRPQPRSPFGWMKPAHQTQPTPEGAPISEPFDFNDPSTAIIGKTRTKDKYRVVYTDHQRVELEKEFYYSRYITIRRKAELASLLGLSERQVKIWFQNRRAKERKQVKKREELTGNQLNHHHQQSQILNHSQFVSSGSPM